MSRAELHLALLLGFIAGLVVALVIAALLPTVSESDVEAAYYRGQAHALNVKPPSEKLEAVCAALWFDKQAQKNAP